MNDDILLIKPGSQRQLYGDLGAFGLTAVEPPLWGALLAGFLRKKGYSVRLLDAEAEDWRHEETASVVSDLNPMVAGVVVSGTNPSASTMNMEGALQILSFLREQNASIKTLLIGLHPSALPELTLLESGVDFLCQGEGFFTLPKLLDALRRGVQPCNIEGLWYQDKGQVISNPRPPLLEDLDTLPMPAWDMLPMRKYRAHNWHCFNDIQDRQPYAVLYTSLGCPFQCSFCCVNALFGRSTIRYRSVGTVVREIDLLVNQYGVKHIKLIDEMFALDETRVTSLCDAVIERGYNLNIWAYARVDTVTQTMLEKMKRAGINWLAYGFESGNDRVIQETNKGYKTERIMDVVKMTRDHGIHICANFIFGLPEDDYDTMNQTLSAMLAINAEWTNIYCAMAYPGSKLYQTALEKDWPLPEAWRGYSQYTPETKPLPTKYLTSGQVLAFRDYAFRTYYQNPRYLNMIHRTFNKETVEHIQRMTSHPLKRKYAQTY